ncbi:MAG: hypothetical protein QOJ51_6393 [Acidobacteriaceae bacterium]|jgi:hypothetical protein|nr:hypothetical protein [Acidobacteriaceae bacterium]MDX6456948.1 hypothetical protein [Acidobacteriaceae bacterium]MEA2263568.1 hypothetical protein [Acidobacteriaceae bacterium]
MTTTPSPFDKLRAGSAGLSLEMEFSRRLSSPTVFAARLKSCPDTKPTERFIWRQESSFDPAPDSYYKAAVQRPIWLPLRNFLVTKGQ